MDQAGMEYVPARGTGHDFQPATRRRLRCPECGYEKTLALEGEVESWENKGGSAWDNDEGPWEGWMSRSTGKRPGAGPPRHDSDASALTPRGMVAHRAAGFEI